jgi:hypothetical protein
MGLRSVNSHANSTAQAGRLFVMHPSSTEAQIWRERHQILYQLVLDLVEEMEQLKLRLEQLEQARQEP